MSLSSVLLLTRAAELRQLLTEPGSAGDGGIPAAAGQQLDPTELRLHRRGGEVCSAVQAAGAADGRQPHPGLLRDQAGLRRRDSPAQAGRLACAVHPRGQAAGGAGLGARSKTCRLLDNLQSASLPVPALAQQCEASVAVLCLSADVCRLWQEFRSNRNPIMLATDVAARGLGEPVAHASRMCNH